MATSLPTRDEILLALATATPFSAPFGMNREIAEAEHGDQADAILDLLERKQQ